MILILNSSSAREALRQCLPEQLKDNTFSVTLKDDSTTKKWLSQVLQNVGIEPPAFCWLNGVIIGKSCNFIVAKLLWDFFLKKQLRAGKMYLLYKCLLQLQVHAMEISRITHQASILLRHSNQTVHWCLKHTSTVFLKATDYNLQVPVVIAAISPLQTSHISN